MESYEKDKRFELGSVEHFEYMKKMRDELLSFGRRFPSPGGSSFYLGEDGTPDESKPRETWITARMVHVYSLGAILSSGKRKEEYLSLASEGIKGLLGELKDTANGGFYAGIKTDGSIIPGKQCYAHAFVILASTTAEKAGVPKAEELLKEAISIYDGKFWDEAAGLSVDTWNTDFTCLEEYRGLNANMHSVEAFLAVADVMKVDLYRERAGRIISKVIAWAENRDYRIPEHYSATWKPLPDYNSDRKDDCFKPYGATPGHGFEWARLIVQWALSSSQTADETQKYINIAEKLFKRALEDGWCAEGSKGIVYTTDWEGNPVVKDRMHWTLAEALNTAAVLYAVTGKQEYAGNYRDFCEYLEEYVHDKKNGSWYHQLDNSNNPSDTVWPGKCDLYHAFQSTLVPFCNPAVSLSCGFERKDVVALGELLIDFISDDTPEGANPKYEANPGGAPCNVLAMLSKLGLKTAFIGKVGDDMFGKQLSEAITSCGIDNKGLVIDKTVNTTLAFVHKLPDGDRDFSFYRSPGADMMLNCKEVDNSLLLNTDIFHFGTLSMTDKGVKEATLNAVKKARAAGALISLDPNYRPPLWKSEEEAKKAMLEAVSLCDILKISDNEIIFITGEDDYDKAVDKLRKMYNIPLIFLTLGKDGSRAYYKDIKVEAPGFSMITVDTTGAGDTFFGAALSRICNRGIDKFTEKDFEEILRFSNAAAALITTKKGALKSMPEPEEIVGLVQRI